MKQTKRLIALVMTTALLQACAGGGTRAPIESRGDAPVATTPAPVSNRDGGRPLPDRPAPQPEPLAGEGATDGEAGPEQLALAAPVEQIPSAPRDAATRSLLAAAMQAATRDDWDRAQAALERAVKLAPDDAGLWYQLAYTHHRRGDQEQALQTAQRALSLPTTPAQRARTWVLVADIETARGNPAAAETARGRAQQ